MAAIGGENRIALAGETRLIMWTGTPPILDPSTIRVVGPDPQRDTFALVANWRFETRRRQKIPRGPFVGGTERKVAKSDPPGFAADYSWGPRLGSFVVEMPLEDARRLMAIIYPPQFVDVTARWRAVPDDFTPLKPRADRHSADELAALRHGLATGDYTAWLDRYYRRKEVTPFAATATGRFFHPSLDEA